MPSSSEPLGNDVHVAAAIVTVSYGSDRVLSGFLDSIAKSDTPDVRVVIADNKAEETVRRLADEHQAHYLPLPRNSGYGGGINAAVSTLPPSVQWVLVSNPDIVLDPHTLCILWARGCSDAGIGAVGPRILTAEGAVYPSARAIPSIRTGVGHALFSRLWPTNPWTRAYRRESVDPAAVRDAGWLSGACLLVRRDLFDRLGGFDPEYFMYFEDVDLGYRIGKAGFRSVYEPAASVVHTGAHSTASAEMAVAMVKAHHDSAKLFLARKYPGPLLAPLRWVLGLGLDARAHLASTTGS